MEFKDLGNIDLLNTYETLKADAENLEKKIKEVVGELYKRAEAEGIITGKGHIVLKIGDKIFKKELRRKTKFRDTAVETLTILGWLEAVDQEVNRKKVERLVKLGSINEEQLESMIEVSTYFVPKVIEIKEPEDVEEE